jgi:hypothetical protein
MSDTTTDFETQAAILSELWMDYRDAEGFKQFIAYNDVGLPLAYMVNYSIAEPTDIGKKFVTEAFDLLLATLEIEDTGFETLEDVLLMSEGDDIV